MVKNVMFVRNERNVIIDVVINMKKGSDMRNKCIICIIVRMADQAKTSYLSGNARTQKKAIVKVKGIDYLELKYYD